MARMGFESSMGKKIEKLREIEKRKREELVQISKDLRRYESALESLRGNPPAETPRKRRTKHELQNEQLQAGQIQ